MAASILFVVVTLAAVGDCLTHRIPNWLCLFALVAGVGLQVFGAESSGAVAVTASVMVPFLVFLPFYAGGGMAAGDVKLMACCGALLGWPAALAAAGYTLVAGMLMGVGVYLYRGGWTSFAARYGTALKLLWLTGSPHLAPALPGSVARSRFPYALAIAAGCVTGVAFPLP